MQQKTIVSSKKLTIKSEFVGFDLLPIKKNQQCTVRIPETILLQKGFIKDWIFISKKNPNHPILKKKRQNMSPLLVVKTFCSKYGFFNVTHNCTTVNDVRDACKTTFKEQKNYDFIKDKKVIQITTITNDILSMTLLDFLDYVAENKYSDQNFFEKWKMIQQKMSFTKIDEYYEVDNVRHNHILQSKCQKIILINTTEATQVSTQIDDDKYKKSAPSKNFSIAETKNLEGYKFFDTFLNKKFFKMSEELVEFIEKNFKCIVEEIRTKFVINKQRQPYLVGIYNIQIKPVKKIADMKDYKIQKEKGFLKIQQYLKFLEIYISQNIDQFNSIYHKNNGLKNTKKTCKGKFCLVPFSELTLPPLLQQKLKLPTLSSGAKNVSAQFRNGIIKRQRKIIQLLKENKIIQQNYEHNEDSSSQYQTSGDQDHGYLHRGKLKNIKICHNCFVFYFHANRFFELDAYNNIIEKKVPITPNNRARTISERKIDHVDDTHQNKKIDQKDMLDLKPITTTENIKKTQSKKTLTPIKHLKQSKSAKNFKNQTELHKSQQKLFPLQRKRNINQPGEKTKTLMSISKNAYSKTHNYKKPFFDTVKQKKPQNLSQALDQILKKVSGFPDSSKEQFIYYAKKYYKDNLPQPIERKSFSSFYYNHLYQFMNNSTVSVGPKQKIKKRPQMSLKRLSELTDYPQIVSKSQFIFETLIVNEEMTIPFCVITTKVINPDNVKPGLPFENIFIINDIFDAFIQYISVAKQLLEDEQLVNKRVILFNYPGQSHTIYNERYMEGLTVSFASVLDKLLYRLSGAKNQMKIINLKNDRFKFCGFGFGNYLLSSYLGSYYQFFPNISSVLLINPFMKMPRAYKEMLENLLSLYSSEDPTVDEEAYLFYNKAINSSQTDRQDLQHKAGLNPIKKEDREYLIRSILREQQESETNRFSLISQQFQKVLCPVTIIYGKSNKIIPKENSQEYQYYRNNKSKEISQRVYLQISSGHDVFADNYDDIFRALTLFARR